MINIAVFDDTSVPNQPSLFGPQAVAGLDFRTATWIVVGAGQVLTVGAAGIASAGSGTNVIAADLTAGADQEWNAGTDNTIQIGGTFDAGGQTVTKTGPGALTIAGPQNHAAGSMLVACAGAVNLNTDAGDTTHFNLSVRATNSAAVTFAATQHLVALDLQGASTSVLTSGGTKTIVTKSLSMVGGATPTAKLDLTDNNLVVDYEPGASPWADVQALVRAGRGVKDGSGQYHWDGMGITSSAASAEFTLKALGVLDDSFTFEGTRTPVTNLEGVPVAPTSVLVKYTYWGDADLNGKVDFNDFDVLQYYYFHPQPAEKIGWQTGDFNYDGKVDFNDFDLLQYAYFHPGGVLGAAVGLPSSLEPIPEPATLALLVAGGLLALARRRRV